MRIVTENEGRRRVARRYEALGPIAAISTTTKRQLEIDDETRHLSILIDESAEQTTRILRAITQENTSQLVDLSVWREAQRLLSKRAQEITIKYPDWWRQLAPLINVHDVRVRRYNAAFGTACETSALVRTFRDDPEGLGSNGTIEVDFEDHAMAWMIFDKAFVQSLTVGRRGLDLSLKNKLEDLFKQNRGKPLDADAVARHGNMSLDSAYRFLRLVVDGGLVQRVNKPQADNHKLYVLTMDATFMPSPNVVFRKIPRVGDFFSFINPFNGEWVKWSR